MDRPLPAKSGVPCTLCKTSKSNMYCEVCQICMCKDCLERHLSDSKVHNVVSLQQYLTTLNYPMCKKHPNKQCERYCEQCEIPICKKCTSSKKHLGHKRVEIFQNFDDKKEVLEKELQELEKSIHPNYEDIASNISSIFEFSIVCGEIE